MKKLKLFIENLLVYGVGGVISKAIPVIMVPIITRLMPNSEYFGISDMSNTIITVASVIAIMGMTDAMYRLFFEKEEQEYKIEICSTTLVFLLITASLMSLCMILFKDFIAEKFFGGKQYAYVVYVTTFVMLVGTINCIIEAPTRMQNKRGLYVMINTISPILSYVLAIPLLLRGEYILAMPLAAALAAVTQAFCYTILNRKWFFLKRFNSKYLKQLLAIAIPMFPNSLIYWVFNFGDKVMITNILGVAATGIYSIGGKLGHISQLIYIAFWGGWQYFAFSTMKEKNQVKSNSLIFEYLGIISFSVCIFVCAWSNSIFRLLFTEEYVSGFIIAPYLFLAPLLQMLFQVACNQFIIIKKTWPNMFILLTGAVLNIFLNIFLIPRIGIEGAAIATLLGYIVSNVICVAVLNYMKLMKISGRFMIAVVIFLSFFILWRLFFSTELLNGSLLATVVVLVYILIYKRDLLQILKIVLDNRR